MADLIQTLKLQSDPNTNVYPNIKADNIPSLAITSAKINTLAVTSVKIASNAVTTPKIADNAVTTSKLADNSVSFDKIQVDAVNTICIRDEAVTTSKLNDNAVTIGKLNLTSATLATLLGTSTSKTALSQLLASRIGSLGHIRFRVSSSSYVGDILFGTHPTSHDVYYNMGSSGWVTISTDSDAATFIAAWGSYIRDYYVG